MTNQPNKLFAVPQSEENKRYLPCVVCQATVEITGTAVGSRSHITCRDCNASDRLACETAVTLETGKVSMLHSSAVYQLDALMRDWEYKFHRLRAGNAGQIDSACVYALCSRQLRITLESIEREGKP